MWPLKKPATIMAKEVESKRGTLIAESEHFCAINGDDVSYGDALPFLEELFGRGLIPVVDGLDGPICLKIESLKKELKK